MPCPLWRIRLVAESPLCPVAGRRGVYRQPGTLTALSTTTQPLSTSNLWISGRSPPSLTVCRAARTLVRLGKLSLINSSEPALRRYEDGARREQAHLPAEQPPACEDPRFPAAHAHPCRSCDPVGAPRQGARPPVGLIRRRALREAVCWRPLSVCGGGKTSPPPFATVAAPVAEPSWCISCSRLSSRRQQINHLPAPASSCRRPARRLTWLPHLTWLPRFLTLLVRPVPSRRVLGSSCPRPSATPWSATW